MKVATRGAKGRASAEGEGAEDSRGRKRREGGELQDACRFSPGFLRGLAALCFFPNGFRERDAALHARRKSLSLLFPRDFQDRRVAQICPEGLFNGYVRVIEPSRLSRRRKKVTENEMW